MLSYSLDDELKSLKAKWKENLDELHLLFALAKEISFTRNVDLLLDQVVERTTHVLRAEAASLLLMNPETMMLDFTVVKGRNSEAIRNLNIHLRPGEGLAGWVAATNKSVIANKADEDPRFKPEIDWLTGYHTRNVLAAPMVAQGKTLGVLEVVNRLEGKEFVEQDAEFLGSIAWLAAMALENAQTYQALESSQEYLANILESLPGGFIGIDLKSRVTHCNSRALEILGLSRNVVGQRYSQALASQAGAVKAIELAFAENQGNKRQTFITVTPWKGRRQVGYSTLTIRNRQGETQGIGLLFQDITEYTAGS